MTRICSVLAVTGVALVLSVCLVTGADKADPKGEFVRPKPAEVVFSTKGMSKAKASYNETIREARQLYKKTVSKARKDYLTELKTALKTKAVTQNAAEKKRVEAEIERIRIELAGGSLDLRDESDTFAYNKLLTYKIKPTDKWM